ncbi:MAG TPA: hypothetical protein VGS20_03035 [Candidatus Acidoferrales bacterium]|nr:hypothetical protein [Candidatus Acidoferrales bacterium]
MLLLADNRLPSVARLVTGEPIRGSWWAHPQSHAIFQASSRLAGHRDVLKAKLIGGKVTFIHRDLWPALYAVGTAREAWQISKLSRSASSLLARVRRAGVVRIDQLARASGMAGAAAASARELSAAARELEARLLIYAEPFHSGAGMHSKRLESWAHWARRARLPRRVERPAEARQQIEQAAARLVGRRESRLLPWAPGRDATARQAKSRERARRKR